MKQADQRSEEDRARLKEREEHDESNRALKAENVKLRIKLEEKEKYLTWYSDSLAQQAAADYDERKAALQERVGQFMKAEVFPFMSQKQISDHERLELSQKFATMQLQVDSSQGHVNQLVGQLAGA